MPASGHAFHVAEHCWVRVRFFLLLVQALVGDDDVLDEVFGGYLVAWERARVGYVDVDSVLFSLQDVGLRTVLLINGSGQQQRAELSCRGVVDRVGPVHVG